MANEVEKIIKENSDKISEEIRYAILAKIAEKIDSIPESERDDISIVVFKRGDEYKSAGQSAESLVKSLDTKVLNIVNILSIPVSEWNSEKTKQIADALYKSDQSLLVKGQLSPQLQKLVDKGTITQEDAEALVGSAPLVFGGLNRRQLEAATFSGKTWNNIPFKSESFIRTSSFEKSIKNYADPTLRKRIDAAIERILLMPGNPEYHKKIETEPGFYAARVTDNYRIKFRITSDNKIELIQFGTHKEILGK